MVGYAVGELKHDFSSIIERVKLGEKICVLYGKAKKPVAVIVPFEDEARPPRKLGRYAGRMSVTMSENFEMSAEELLGP